MTGCSIGAHRDAVGAAALAAVTTGWIGARLDEAADRRLSPRGGVPLTDGDHAAPSGDERQRAAKRRVQRLGTASLVSELALVSVNAALAQRDFRRPPVRRLVPRLGRV